MKSHKGFVLLMTLGIIFLMSMLLFASMQHVLVYFKAINQQESQHQHFYQLEHLANQLIATHPLAFGASCLVRNRSVNQILHQLSHQKGCIFIEDHIQYRYLINDLGSFPCLVVQKNHQEYASHHYSLSLFVETKEGVASVLQVRFIQLGLVMQCVGEKHFLTTGMSSWRYLPEYNEPG